jgi:hypothetical protein
VPQDGLRRRFGQANDTLRNTEHAVVVAWDVWEKT